MKHILVTGHTGFIGKTLVSSLERRGSCCTLGASYDEGINLCEKSALASFHNIDVIVHLAGSVGVMSSWENPETFYENNLIPTLRVLEYSRKNGIEVIYVSSYVYGAPQYLPIDEAHIVCCMNPYASSKRQAELLCQAYTRDFGVRTTILRPFNIYGFGQSDESLISMIVKQALSKDVVQVRDLRPCRDYLYIEDFVNAIERVVNSSIKQSDIFNLGFGKSFSVQEVIDLVLRVTGKKIPVHCLEIQRKNEIMDCYSDSTKFRNQFQWAPQYDLEAGVRQMVKQYGKSRIS